LRRCTDELDPNPAHPGCVYSEMKMCLAPCYQGCTDQRYGEEAAAVEQFLSTRGESRLVTLRAQREEASAQLQFESAAALHAQVQRVEGVRALAPELVRPLSQLHAVILQASAEPDEVAVFLYEGGLLRGPALFSTLGMRIQNEQSGSSSLFAQPMAFEPVPETPPVPSPSGAIEALKGTGFSPYIESAESGGAGREGFQPLHSSPEGGLSGDSPEMSAQPAKLPRGLLESRMEAALAALAEAGPSPSATLRQGHLALLKRWYYRSEVRRAGEIFFPDAEGRWPVKAMLRGIGRVAAKQLAPSIAQRT
jgi:hypothetical protein